MRAGPLSDGKVIALLNRFFVPVYLSIDDYATGGGAPAADKAALKRICGEIWIIRGFRAQLTT